MKRLLIHTYCIVLFIFFLSCSEYRKNDSYVQSDIENMFNMAKQEYLNLNSPDSALKIAKLATRYGLENKNFELAFRAMIMSASIYNEKRMEDSVRILMNKLIPMAKQQDDSVHLASAYHSLSYSYDQQNQPDSSLYFQELGLKYARSKNNPMLPALYIEKAKYMTKNNKFDSTYVYYTLALEHYREIGNYLNMAVVYNYLFDLFFVQNLTKESKKYLQLAIHINDSLGNIVELAKNYNNMAILMRINSQPDSAAFFLKKSVAICKETGDKHREIISIYNLGNTYTDMGDYDKAKANYTKVYEYCKKEQIQEGVVNALSGMAENEDVNNNNRDSALEMLKEALWLTRKMNDPQTEAAILFQIVQKKIPRSVDSLNYLMQYKILNDSLSSADYKERIAENEVKYETELKNESIKLLKSKNKQQKLLMSVFIGGFILLFILVFVILRSLSLNRKANKMLAAQKEEIVTQAEQLKNTNRKLVELDQFKHGMISMIVHDLKNPLNTILNISEKEPERGIVRARQAAGQMLNMVLNILDVNKYEHSGMKIRETEFSLFKKAQKSIEQISFLARQKNILIENNMDISISVNGEPEIIERVFVNLFSNAIKYTPVNGKIELSSQIDKKKEQVILSVKDTGQGISKEYHEKIFEKFVQIEAKNSGAVHSTGLGLTFCKIAVEAHDGKIWIDDNYADGTSISFSLPLGMLHYQENESPFLPLENVWLSEQEKKELKRYLLEIEQLEIYEISLFRKLFRDIEQKKIINERWLLNVKNAVKYGNQMRLEYLINLIKQ